MKVGKKQIIEVEAKAHLSYIMAHFSIPNDLLEETYNLFQAKWNAHVSSKWTEKILNVHCTICVYLIAKSAGIVIGIRNIKNFLGPDYGYFSKTILKYNYSNATAWRAENVRKLINEIDKPDDVKCLAERVIDTFPTLFMNTTEIISAVASIIAASRLLYPNKKTGTVALCKKFGISTSSVTNRTKELYKILDKAKSEQNNLDKNAGTANINYFKLLDDYKTLQNNKRAVPTENSRVINYDLHSKISSNVKNQLGT